MDDINMDFPFGKKDEWVTVDKFVMSERGARRLKEGTLTNLCLCEQKFVGARNVPANVRFKINKKCPIHGAE